MFTNLRTNCPGACGAQVRSLRQVPDTVRCWAKVWMTQQARNLSLFLDQQPVVPRYLLRDNDGKFDPEFDPEFDQILEAEGVGVVRTQVRSPNMNAYAERFVQSIKSECLDMFLFFGESHLRHVISE